MLFLKLNNFALIAIQFFTSTSMGMNHELLVVLKYLRPKIGHASFFGQ